MDAVTTTRFEVVPLTKHIGAEIRGIDLRDRLDAGTIGTIRQAWLDHLVLVFRGQQFSQEDLVRATAYFGEIGPLSRPPKYFPKGYSKLLPNVMMISNIRENGEIIGALARRRNEFPSRHDPQRVAPQRHAALFGRNPEPWRRHAVRQRLCRL